MAKERKPKPPMLITPESIRALRERLGLTIEQAAAKVGAAPRTWRAWEQPSQGRKPTAAQEILIRLMDDGAL